MDVGDLVKFHTNAVPFKHAELRYASPGIILEQYMGLRYLVLWADNKTTVEHFSFLKLTDEN